MNSGSTQGLGSSKEARGFTVDAVRDLSVALTALLADLFALYLKTKNFCWHVGGAHFYHHRRLLDRQANEILAITDVVAERVRKVGGTTLRSIGHIAHLQRLIDNDAQYVTPHEMLAELREDNSQLVMQLRQAHGLCRDYGDIATAGIIEHWIDQAEERVWFLSEVTRDSDCE
jgi:starvation-inducible DNA-binding protein